MDQSLYRCAKSSPQSNYCSNATVSSQKELERLHKIDVAAAALVVVAGLVQRGLNRQRADPVLDWTRVAPLENAPPSFRRTLALVVETIKEVGGYTYYDGANLNALLGKIRPGDMGFDIIHLNLHKTFATPHGGGGPGAGPVCVSKEVEDYLPVPLVEYDGSNYYLSYELPKKHWTKSRRFWQT
jgi:hypothetical protein